MNNKRTSYDNIIIGAGITGITLAERLSDKGKTVLIIEKRNHIGGNCYDYFDNEGNYIQKYGPHIFHTNDKKVWDYLSKFTEWNDYEHRVIGKIQNKLVPILFNFKSIDMLFGEEEAGRLKNILEREYGLNKKVPILELKKNENAEIRELAEFIYENVFLNYTIKQWDLKPEGIHSSVTARVPVMVGYDDRYFQDKYQGIPSNGFSEMFKKMLSSPLIKVRLGVDYKDVLFDYDFDNLFYTGPLDYFFDYKFSKIKYRRIDLRLEKHERKFYQDSAVVNYPNDEDFTRITEFNKFLGIENGSVIISKEFPSWDVGFQAYPVQTEDNGKLIERYQECVEKFRRTKFMGRLAKCKYYDMDDAVREVLEVVENDYG